MRNIIQIEMVDIICDHCKEKIEDSYEPIVLTYNYPHVLDGEEYIFCSDHCLRLFINILNPLWETVG